MADQKVSVWRQAAMELFYYPALLSFVKIHHHVSAKNHVVPLRKEFCFEIVKIEVYEFLHCRFYRVTLSDFVEITKPIVVIHCCHLVFAVNSFLASAKHRVADVARRDFNRPRRRDQRLGPRGLCRTRHSELVISQCVGDQHSDRVSLLSRRASGAPNPQAAVSAGLFLANQLVKNVLMKEFQLCLVAKEAGLVDREIFQQTGKFMLAFRADQQPVVAVKGIHAALAQTALQAVLKKMRPPSIKKHAALLIHERLQQPHFSVTELDSQCWRAHRFLLRLLSGRCARVLGLTFNHRTLPQPDANVEQPAYI